MTDSTDEIRADIERTRAGLGLDVDALADKVTPSKIAHRQADKVRGALGSVRDRVMGVADDASSSASGLAHDAGDAAHHAKSKIEGAPLAVGLIAFGAGLLISSLIPASRKEKELADSVKDAAQPLLDEVSNVAKEVAGDLQQPAQEAAEAVKDRATEAVDAVKSEASDAADTVQGQVQQSKDNVAG